MSDLEKTRSSQEKTEKKRQKEQKVVGEMIALYCRKNHKDVRNGGISGVVTANGGNGKRRLCPECQELLDYAAARSERCPFMEQKTFCANCKVHCYKPRMRERIRQVMRFSGPRMLFYHPVLAVWHLVCSIREKKGNKVKV